LRLDKCEVEPFNLKDFIKQDIAWSYLRKSHESGTVANWSQSLMKASYGKSLRALVACMNAPTRIRFWRKAATDKDLGGSLWARFTRLPDTKHQLGRDQARE
jgi:hypothetical protein